MERDKFDRISEWATSQNATNIAVTLFVFIFIIFACIKASS